MIVASVQTLRSAKRQRGARVSGLVIIDECHHVPAAKVYLDYRSWADSTAMPVAGFTATLNVTTCSGSGTSGRVSPIAKYCVCTDVEHGYLVTADHSRRIAIVEPRWRRERRSGDYSSAALGQAMHDAERPERDRRRVPHSTPEPARSPRRPSRSP